MASINDIHQFLRDKAGSADDSSDSLAEQLVRSCRVLEAMGKSNDSEAIVYLKGSHMSGTHEGIADSSFEDENGAPNRPKLYAAYHEKAFRLMGFDWRTKEATIGDRGVRIMYMSGSSVTALLTNEVGYCLMCSSRGELGLDEVGFLTAADPDFQKLKDAILSDELLTEPVECKSIESLKPLKVLRLWNESIDFRTGETKGGHLTGERLLPLIQSGLPLPQEFNQEGN